jgi:PEP-CTERM motif
MNKRIGTFLILLSLTYSSSSSATLFDVYLDHPFARITGQVDTITDVFTASSWLDPSGLDSVWTPNSSFFPLTYTATDASGGVFDVPDNWDGLIDTTWGFIADLSNDEITWLEGDYLEDNRHHGWGAGIGANGNVHVEFYTQDQLQWVATGRTSVRTLNFNTVSVKQDVPVPATLSLMALALAALGWSRRVKPLAII